MHAEKTITKVSRSYRKFARNLSRKIHEMDRYSELSSARKKAKEEGIQEGILIGEAKAVAKGEAKADKKIMGIARKMKKAGIPINEIAEFTEIQPDIIEKL